MLAFLFKLLWLVGIPLLVLRAVVLGIRLFKVKSLEVDQADRKPEDDWGDF